MGTAQDLRAEIKSLENHAPVTDLMYELEKQYSSRRRGEGERVGRERARGGGGAVWMVVISTLNLGLRREEGKGRAGDGSAVKDWAGKQKDKT